MRQYLRITRYPYAEPYHLNLVMEASNGSQTSRLEFYCNADDLLKVANALESFPRHEHHLFLWELGTERPEDRFAYYFRFRVFAVNCLGKCAIQVRFNNHAPLPEREIAGFCISDIEPAPLDRLKGLISQFAELKHQVLEWQLNDGWLLERAEEN